MLTLGAILPDPDDRTTIQDIENRTVDGLESVRQRVVQRLQFWSRQWFLNESQGVPYTPDILGHQFDISLAKQALVAEILTVADVTNVRDVEAALDAATRRFSFAANVDTVYGATSVSGTQ